MNTIGVLLLSAAPLFNDLGNLHHPVTTSVPRAQRYFDQGLTVKKDAEASVVEVRFKRAWEHADVTLASSRF